MVDVVLSSEPENIVKCISRFYRQLYSENVAHRPILDNVEFSRISKEDAIWLERPFDEEEVFGGLIVLMVIRFLGQMVTP